MPDSRNLYIAIGLSIAILIGWQYFFVGPEIERAQQQQEIAAQAPVDSTTGQATGPATAGQPAGATPTGVAAGGSLTREEALARSPRVEIATQRLSGSINLVGGRLDDLRLTQYRETVDPTSPTIVLLSPSGAPEGYFAELGWIGSDAAGPMPGPQTEWTAPQGARLTEASPVTLTYDNGAGLVFTRTLSVDDNYMFTVVDAVTNKGTTALSLTPYGRVTRLGATPKGWWILHEGMIGVFGDEGLQQVTYGSLQKDGEVSEATATRGWLGITDKYWATTLIPPQGNAFDTRFSYVDQAGTPLYQADFRGEAVAVPAGGSAETTNRVFAGAKVVQIVDGYEQSLGIDRFELLIDWGWFYFVTKPLFFVIDWFYRFLGNFGLAILAVTVLVKGFFFPLANKSYKSMSAMKKVAPQMTELRERFKDDKVKQQQALMELYKKEKINPLAGCWPIAIQIPVFFALYKVLFVTIEMRHAPFFGWIQDLAAPDPTTIFNLFGLIPWTPPHLLMVGAWPLIMGVTMFVQMRLNPTPPDPTQRIIFTWMPLIFTFMLASFPAGLVIYWAWNNTLSVTQQYIIMRRQGVDVNLLGNIMDTVLNRPAKPDPAAKPAGAAASAKTVGAEPAEDEAAEADADAATTTTQEQSTGATAQPRKPVKPKRSRPRGKQRKAPAKG
jgi:YidC/Oxa1 family membrane protein insertase